MSARKFDTTTSSLPQITVEARQARLSLPPEAVLVRRNGIEFRSTTPFSLWTEMTVTLEAPHNSGQVHCNGIVVGCSGNRHLGYIVSMLFTGLSKQSQALLNHFVRPSA